MIDVMDLFNACVYIQDHLDADLSLMFLADTVGLSRFRFHRVFKAWRGETLHDFVTRMRMERAAFELAYPLPASRRRSIKAIAFASGYKSLSSFSHAFSSYASLSPREYRNRALRGRAARPADTCDGRSLGGYAISVQDEPAREVVVFDPVPRAGDRVAGAARAALDAARHVDGDRYGIELLPNLFARARGRAHRDGPGDRSSALSCIGVEREAWQRASAARVRGGSVATPRATLGLDAGRYAVVEGRGSLTGLYRAWRRHFDAWLAAEGECPRPGRIYMRFADPGSIDADVPGDWSLHIPLETPAPRVQAKVRPPAGPDGAERTG